jgi:hypothetical protein
VVLVFAFAITVLGCNNDNNEEKEVEVEAPTDILVLVDFPSEYDGKYVYGNTAVDGNGIFCFQEMDRYVNEYNLPVIVDGKVSLMFWRMVPGKYEFERCSFAGLLDRVEIKIFDSNFENVNVYFIEKFMFHNVRISSKNFELSYNRRIVGE